MTDAAARPIMVRLLGGATLEVNGAIVGGPAARRHPMALLAMVATAPSGSFSRDSAVAILWPDADESTGRNRLTSVIYELRQVLGRHALVSTAGRLHLGTDGVACDVRRFRALLDAGDLSAAVSAYAGPYLDGFHLPGSTTFEDHLEVERHHLHRAWWEAVGELAWRATKAGSHRDAASHWRALAVADPYDARVAVNLMSALAAAGDRAGARRAGRDHARRIRDDLGVEPAVEWRAQMERLSSPTTSIARPSHLHPVDTTVAVLPFRSIGDATDESFAEGLHGGVITRLSQLAGLATVARTSVEHVRDPAVPASEIGRRLGAGWLLEGEVHLDAQKFGVNVRLIEAPADRQVWGRSWEGEYSTDDVFGVQLDIAGRIVNSLPLVTSRGEQLLLGRHPTDDLEAYRLTAQGQMHLRRRTEEDMETAVDCFERALDHDPAHAPARVGTANALGLMHAYGFRDSSVMARCEEEIEAALRLEPRSAEAHAALARLRGQRRQVPDANRLLRRAIELQPGYAEAHNWLAVGYLVAGRGDESLRSARRALSLDPLSPEVIWNVATGLLITGDQDAALQELDRALEISPSYTPARLSQGIAHREAGRPVRSVAVLDGVEVPFSGDAPRTVLALASIDLGDRATARRIADDVADAHPFDQGLVLAALGEVDAAFAAFDREHFDRPDFDVTYWPSLAVRFLFEDVWERVRHDGRYQQLVRRLDRAFGLLDTVHQDAARGRS